MSKFVKTLALFFAGLQLSTAKTASVEGNAPRIEGGEDLKGVTLQPLNGKFDNLFAGHSSHSSHRSHASHSSHYSGSSGYSTPYVAPAPAPAPAPITLPAPTPSPAAELVPTLDPSGSVPSASDNSDNAGGKSTARSSASTKHAPTKAAPAPYGGSNAGASDVPMTLAEKLRLQIIRVQIRLNSLGLYNGQITGTLDQDTRTALKLFQKVKNLPESGQMTTPTLNALGIPAVK